MNLKKKLSILTAFAVFQAFAVIPANAQSADQSDTTSVNTAKVKSVEVVKKEQTIAESEVKSGTNTPTSNNETTEEVNPETDVPTGTDATPVEPVIEPTDEEGTAEETPAPAPVEVEQPSTGGSSVAGGGGGDLTLYMNSNKMMQDGKTYLAGQPMAVKNGVSYVAIRALVDRVGYDVKYDNTTKETIIISGEDELRFKTNSKIYTVNGVSRTMKGAAYQQKNTFMVPLTSITQALDISYKVNQSAKTVVLNLSTKPVASFTVQKEVFAGDQVTYTTRSSSPKGLSIVDERWTGRQDSFDQPGVYTVTYAVQDSSGQWSDPYSVTIKVERPNLPPVAMFTTDKEEYKMGEKITYIDQSTDDENAIVKTEWDNNALAFFVPGPKTVTITVTDKHGASDSYTKMINITGETLYSVTDFNQLFTPVGEKFTFDGGGVPALEKVPFTYYDEPSLLIRSNSPETVNTEGIVYKESSFGQTRFMIHHVNNTGKNVKMYVVATNNNAYTASIDQQNMGFAGPSPFATVAGKLSIDRWFQSMQNGTGQKKVYIQPGESKLILNDLSVLPMKQGQVISLYSDVFSDYELDYNIIMIEENKDPMEVLSSLPVLDRDGVHNRGTYPNATRIITYDQEVGSKPARLPLGDNASDPNLVGTDPMAYTEASNAGNFGVLYKITLNNVAPRTLISFNPRGGRYSGVALVNGQVVQISTGKSVTAPNEQSVMYRTGSYGESVTILFSAAPGSNLPVNLLFTPLPAEK
ncbi:MULTISPECIES: stalk domain-containing protein [unclassified Paenibacillus]|uniref:stalk domain-containing protein n=1 Tax=unclassified Paenibacillus TaxID=185978 RepID=UPI000CFD4A27|nr:MULTISPECIES: stalk domain-containing protein [unclassified Paenibacillus]PRA05290.1 DNA-directed RNA polymerase subunit beta [Paenibacillus sp. MYb63]PRA50364.1 DNA-directed RNA polymerase subunit beta [Paenibacillus sp. MYb67]QZN75171.1 copper amine oxidase N-terminal domain-containing protein [Paenibacillus sp. DR312]